MRRIYLTLLLVCVGVCGIILWKPTARYVVQGVVSSYFLERFGIEVEADKVARREGKWVFEHFVGYDEKSGVGVLRTEEMAVEIALNLWERQLLVHVELLHPQICLASAPMYEKEKKAQKGSSTHFSFLTVKTDFFVSEGVLFCADHALHFNVAGHFSPTIDGECVAWIPDSKSAIRLMAKENNIDIHAQDFPCPILSMFVGLWNPHYRDWIATSGEMSGKLLLQQKKLGGQFEIQNLALEYPKANIHAEIPLVNATFPELASGHVEFKGHVALQKQELELQDVVGSLSFQPQGVIDIQLNGTGIRQNKSKSFTIVGSGCYPNTLDLLAQWGEKSSANLAFQHITDGLYDFTAAMSHLTQDEIGVVQTFIGRQDFIIENVTMDAQMTGHFYGMQLCDLNVHQINGHDLVCHIPKTEWKIVSDAFSADCGFDIISVDPIQSLFASVTLQQGKMKANNFPDLQFDTVSTVINHGVWQQFQGNVTCSDVTTQLSWDRSMPYSYFHVQGKGSSFAPQFSDHPITIDATFNQTGKIEGTLCTAIDQLAFEISLEAFSESVETNNWIQTFLTLTGFKIKEGWLKGEHLVLQDYVAPFLFDSFLCSGNVEVKGWGDLLATFDQESLVLYYNPHDFVLNHPYFTLQIPSLNSSERYPAVHYFDLTTGRQGGFIPLQGATYVEKQTGLNFTNIKADLLLGSQNLYTDHVEAQCNDIHLGGDLRLDFTNKQTTVDVHAYTISGSLKSVQNLSPSMPAFLRNMPLEASINARDEGGHLHVVASQNEIKVDAHIKGYLSDGSWQPSTGDLSLQHLSTNFEYDYTTRNLLLSDIHGTILVGSQPNLEEYAFTGDIVRFSDLINSKGEFDLWIGEKNRDIVRIAGTTSVLPATNHLIECQFNRETTHFGDVHPKDLSLVLNNWSHIDHFHLSLDFKLQTLMQDLFRLYKTGLFLPSESVVKRMNTLQKGEGQFSVDFAYDHPSSLLTYFISGKDVIVDQQHFSSCTLQGKKQDSIWSIDQLQIDELSLAAEISKIDSYWRAHFVGGQFGQSCKIGLEGNFFPTEGRAEAKIKLLEVELQHLKEWPSLEKFVKTMRPIGSLRAAGTMQFVWCKDRSKWDIGGDFFGILRDWSLADMSFQDTQPFSLKLYPNHQITLNHVDTAFNENALHLEKVSYDLLQQSWNLQNLAFSIPQQKLKETSQLLQEHFPQIFQASFMDVFQEIKPTNNLEGFLSYKGNVEIGQIHLDLKEGNYRLFDREYQVAGCTIDCDSHELFVRTQMRNQDHTFHSTVHSQLPQLDAGELILTHQAQETTPLTIVWKKINKDFFIQKINGTCAGITAQLAVTDDTEKGWLTGTVIFDTNHMQPWLSAQGLQQYEQWQLKGDIKMKGSWNTRPEHYAFKGVFESDNGSVRGIQLDHAQATLSCSPQTIHAQSMKIQDSAGTAVIEQLSAYQEDGQWSFIIPELTITALRPAKLKWNGAKLPQEISLFIPRLQMENLRGDPFNTSTWNAKGMLTFVNNAKTDTSSAHEFDYSILYPVSGQFNYELADRKICLKSIKDTYSQDKLAKYDLPKNAQQTFFIDFDGNINLQMKIKPNTLIQKLAKLFTLNIQGSLLEPKFSIVKDDEAISEIAVK